MVVALRLKDKFYEGIKWILIIFFSLYTLLPILWLFITSLKSNAEYFANPFTFPAVPQIGNYINAITQANLFRMTLNSISISAVAVLLNLFVASMAAYALSRFSFRGKEVIFIALSAGIMVPLNALMVPYYQVIHWTHMYDSLNALRIVYAAIGLPISILIIRGFIDSVPREIEEAAYVDGCGFFGRFFKIVLPLSKCGIITAGTFQFITCWNEFVYANLLTSSPEHKTIQLGIRYFTNQFTTDYVSMFAAIVVAIVPSIIIYAFFQDQIVSGLTAGATKG